MSPAYLIAQATSWSARVPRASFRPQAPLLKLSDPARQAMTDFLRDPPLTVDESCSVEQAMDQMFASGVRCLLVVRDLQVMGLISAAQAACVRPYHRCIADSMTPTEELPAIDWDTLEDARVADLLEIFEGTGVEQLIVLESHSATLTSVRGLVHRARLRRQLGSSWSLQSGLM